MDHTNQDIEPGSLLALDIEELAVGGRGLSHAPDGRVVFVAGALLGEKVQARITTVKRGYLEAELGELLQASDQRVEPACPWYAQCGGCEMMHLDYPAQVEAKAAWVTGALSRLGTMPEARVIASPQQLGYRHRVRFQVTDGKIGLFSQASHSLVEIESCAVAAPEINSMLAALRQAMEGEVHKLTEWVEVISGIDKRSFVTFGLASPEKPSRPHREELRDWGRRAGAGGTRLSLRNRPEPMQYSVDSGTVYFQDDELTMWAFPGQFFQANLQANRLLIDEVVQAAGTGSGGQALDLFAGSGNFSLPLARAGWQVVAVEGALGADAAGSFMLEQNPGLGKVKFHQASVEPALKQMASQGKKYDLVMLDPPRHGAKGQMPRIAGRGAGRVIYVSCHPATLARDAGVLIEQGYQPASLSVVDMFPHTAHVEAVLVFDSGSEG